MLSLKGVTTEDEGRHIKSTYQAKHSQVGRGGTVLTLDVEVEVDTRFGRATARVLIEPKVDGGTPEQALDKLADWAERLSIAIRQRGQPSQLVPVFTTPLEPDQADDLPD